MPALCEFLILLKFISTMPPFTPQDTQHMQLALALAWQGRFSTSKQFVGKTDKAADKLFAELKKEIEGDQSVKDVQVDEASADSVAYRYTQANEDSATNESCIAHLSADKELVVVCATSGQMSANELKGLLASSVKFN